MRRAFVTGANGFIGSHLVEALLSRGDEVVGLVRTTSDTRSLAPLFQRFGSRLRLVVGDLHDPATLRGPLADVDYVFHLGAVLLGTSEREFMETNVQGTDNLCQAVAQVRGAHLERFVFTSSLAAAGPSPNGEPIDERAEPRPVSWYGRSKLEAERIVARFAATGLPTTICRPVAVYGERERDLSGGMFPAVQLGFKPMVGFRRKTLSMVYVGDLVAGLIAAAESPAAVGRTYFLSDPDPYRDTAVVRAVADALRKRIRIPLITPHVALAVGAVLVELLHRFRRGRPTVTRDKVREIRQRWWAATPKAALKDLGWAARVTLSDGMRRAVADWKQRKADRHLTREPLRDRAIKTYLVAMLFGVVVEAIAQIGSWYAFQPWWLVFVVIMAVFGGVMGTIALLAARAPIPVQFALGAAVGIGAELLNYFWLHSWEFSPAFLARLPSDPWLLALALGLPAGLMPILVNGIAQALYGHRLRVG